MNAIDILKEARALVERGWTQNAMARDEYGAVVDYQDDAATCFCMNGAMWRAAWPFRARHSAGYIMAEDVLRHVVGGNYAHWNDAPERTQGEIIDAFDKAIAYVEEQL